MDGLAKNVCKQGAPLCWAVAASYNNKNYGEAYI